MLNADDYYEVSIDGTVKSNEHIDARGRLIKERIVSPVENGSGYMQCNIIHNGKRKKRYVHRLVAEAFIPNPAHLPEVDHIDNDRANNAVENLRWVTHKENMKKMGSNKVINGRVVHLCECGREKSSNKSSVCAFCRKDLRRSNIPSVDELLSILYKEKYNLESVGRIYHVTGNAVKRWCKIRQINIHELKGS